MVPLVIRPAHSQKEGLQSDGHENMLIFNTIRGECERFEPHGSQTRMTGVDRARLNKSIQKFTDDLGLGLKYVPSDAVTES